MLDREKSHANSSGLLVVYYIKEKNRFNAATVLFRYIYDNEQLLGMMTGEDTWEERDRDMMIPHASYKFQIYIALNG